MRSISQSPVLLRTTSKNQKIKSNKLYLSLIMNNFYLCSQINSNPHLAIIKAIYAFFLDTNGTFIGNIQSFNSAQIVVGQNSCTLSVFFIIEILCKDLCKKRLCEVYILFLKVSLKLRPANTFP